MDNEPIFHVCGLSDEELAYERECMAVTMDERVLNIKDKYEERKFIITNIIRMLAMMDFEEETVQKMYNVSKQLRKIEMVEGIITDDTLFEWFCKGGELL